jgi:hypothetical protein
MIPSIDIGARCMGVVIILISAQLPRHSLSTVEARQYDHGCLERQAITAAKVGVCLTDNLVQRPGRPAYLHSSRVLGSDPLSKDKQTLRQGPRTFLVEAVPKLR